MCVFDTACTPAHRVPPSWNSAERACLLRRPPRARKWVRAMRAAHVAVHAQPAGVHCRHAAGAHGARLCRSVRQPVLTLMLTGAHPVLCSLWPTAGRF
ncbi:hypothetical protein EON67_09635 [archaeon]|nr:MAG: hypothetical protein EON67_09635 [archaeon]